MLVAVTMVVTVGAAAPASARVGGGDRTARNTAVVVNTRDGAARWDLAFSLRRLHGDEVTAKNLALAYASCESCKTVAIAFQIALVAGKASHVVAVNRAIAVNDHCSSCDTLAAAYQFVVVTSGRARLTPHGYQELAAIRHQLRALAGSGRPSQEIQAGVAGLAERVRSVLASELVMRSSRHEVCRSHGAPGTACTTR